MDPWQQITLIRDDITSLNSLIDNRHSLKDYGRPLRSSENCINDLIKSTDNRIKSLENILGDGISAKNISYHLGEQKKEFRKCKNRYVMDRITFPDEIRDGEERIQDGLQTLLHIDGKTHRLGGNPDLLKIEKDMGAIRDLNYLMASMVEADEAKIQSIETTTKKTREHTTEAAMAVGQAALSASRQRKLKKWCCLITCVIMIIVCIAIIAGILVSKHIM